MSWLTREQRMYDSLAGLSVGDAFGGQFYDAREIPQRQLRPGPWRWSDDTEMALSIVAVLRRRGAVDQDELAASFAAHFDAERGYGPAMTVELLPDLAAGRPWREAAPALFHGQGTFGNGAAMRVAPLGAFFADDLPAVVEQARRSAEVTHAHPEGIAGAIGVAVAAACAAQQRRERTIRNAWDMIAAVLPWLPASAVRRRLEAARDTLPADTPPEHVARRLGTGTRVSAQDTVPFCVWMAGRHLADYSSALWATAAPSDDIDTTCAIVGGIVAAHVGTEGIEAEWRDRREPLPEWPFAETPDYSDATYDGSPKPSKSATGSEARRT